MPISVSVILPDEEVVFDQLPDDTALQLKEEISKRYGFPVGKITLLSVIGAKIAKDEVVLADEKRFQKLKIHLPQRGGA
jgi:hypothetical protein